MLTIRLTGWLIGAQTRLIRAKILSSRYNLLQLLHVFLWAKQKEKNMRTRLKRCEWIWVC